MADPTDREYQQNPDPSIVPSTVGGDVVAGDKVGGDKNVAGPISGGTVAIGTGATAVTHVYHVAPPQTVQERRNRHAMLQKVHTTWIKGVLEQSLHGAVLL